MSNFLYDWLLNSGKNGITMSGQISLYYTVSIMSSGRLFGGEKRHCDVMFDASRDGAATFSEQLSALKVATTFSEHLSALKVAATISATFSSCFPMLRSDILAIDRIIRITSFGEAHKINRASRLFFCDSRTVQLLTTTWH